MKETKKVLVDFGGNRSWCVVVEKLRDGEAIVTWDQPGVGMVTGCVHRMGDTHPETGEPIWTWNGDFEPISE